MSETFRVGDPVVFRDVNGELLKEFGVMHVAASDLSTVKVTYHADNHPNEFVFNAGTLRCSKPPGCFKQCIVAHPAQDDITAIYYVDVERALREGIGTFLETRPQTESTLRAAYAALKGDVPQCYACAFWRPPFNHGPGNCHNQDVRELTRIGNETFPPPTPAEFGCNQWQAKQPPENGDDSDE